MRFLDPRPEVAPPVDGPSAPHWGGSTDAVVFGLLANGFPGFGRLLGWRRHRDHQALPNGDFSRRDQDDAA